MNVRPMIAATLASCALAACAPQEKPAESALAATAPAVKVTGPPQDCIPLKPMASSVVRDNRTIDFIVSGRRGYRNALPSSCPGLKSANGFTYGTSLSQLCGTDIIYTLENYGGSVRRGAACGLGQFVPVEFQR